MAVCLIVEAGSSYWTFVAGLPVFVHKPPRLADEILYFLFFSLGRINLDSVDN